MNISKYTHPLNDADLVSHITSLTPLLFWIWFGKQLTKHMVSPTSKIGIRISSNIAIPLRFLHILMFLLWMIPIIISIRDIYYALFVNRLTGKNSFEPTTPSLPPGYGFCMTTDVKKDDAKKGVVAYWNYECEKQNRQLIDNSTMALLNRFYYINYAIFLIVLLVYNVSEKFNVLSNKFVLLNMRVALLLGVVGCILPVFSPGFYLKSLWAQRTWAHILNMNAVCLMLIGLSLMTYSNL